MKNHSNCKKCKTGVICKELEADLSQFNSNRQSKAAKRYSNIDSIATTEPRQENIEDQIRDLRKKLVQYAMPRIYIDVLVYVSLHEGVQGVFGYAAKEYDMPSWQTAKALYEQGLKLLKERGFK